MTREHGRRDLLRYASLPALCGLGGLAGAGVRRQDDGDDGEDDGDEGDDGVGYLEPDRGVRWAGHLGAADNAARAEGSGPFESGPARTYGLFLDGPVPANRPPTVVGDVAYTVADGQVLAVDLDDGEVLWPERRTDGDRYPDSPVRKLQRQPAAYRGSEGTLVYAMRSANEGGGIAALNGSTGAIAWHRTLDESVSSGTNRRGLPPSRSPTVVTPPGGDPLVLAPTTRVDRLDAYHAVTGAHRWTHSGGVGSVATYGLADGPEGTRPLVYTVDTDRGSQTVTAVDPTDGTAHDAGRWPVSLSADEGQLVAAANQGRGSAPVSFAGVDGGTVYLAQPQSPADRGDRTDDSLFYTDVHALSAATGESRWTERLPRAFGHTPATDGERVYVAARDRLWILDAASGEVLATYEMPPVGPSVAAPEDAFEDDAGIYGTRGWAYGPTVADGRVYVADNYGALHVVDAESGTRIERRVFDGEDGGPVRKEAPTVLEDTLLVRLDEGLLHAKWDGGLQVSVPAETTLLSGVRNTVEVTLRNATEQTIAGIGIDPEEDVEVPDEHVTDPTVETLAPSMAPGEQQTVELSVDVAPAPASIGVSRLSVAVEADGPYGGADVGAVTVERTLELAVDLPGAAAPLEAGEDVADFSFEVTCNDERAVEDVAVVARFAEVEGDWATIDDVPDGVAPGPSEAPFDGAYDDAGGAWTELGTYDDKRWDRDGLEAGATARPGLRVDVPEGIAETDRPRVSSHTFVLDGYVAVDDGGESGQPGELVNSVRATVPVYERRVKVAAYPPPERQAAGDEFTLSAFVGLEDDPLEDVAVRFEVPAVVRADGTERFEVLLAHEDTGVERFDDGPPPDGEFTREDGTVVWRGPGPFEPGTLLGVTLRLRTPERPLDSGAYEVPVSAAATPRGGSRLDPNTDSATVRLFEVEPLYDRTLSVAETIDRYSLADVAGSTQTGLVREFCRGHLDRSLTERGGDVDRTDYYDTGVRALQRAHGGELVLARTAEMYGHAPRDGDLLLSGTTDLNLVGTLYGGAKAFATGAGVGRAVSGRFGDEFADSLRGGITEWLLTYVTGKVQKLQDYFFRLFLGVSLGSFSGGGRDVDVGRNVRAQADAMAGDLFDGATDDPSALVDRSLPGGRDAAAVEVLTYLYETAGIADDRRFLLRQLRPEEVEGGGLAADQATAERVAADALKYLEGVAVGLSGIIDDWSDDLVQNLTTFFERVADLVAAVVDDTVAESENGALYNLLTALYDALQLLVDFTVGGAFRVVISVGALTMLERAQNALIDGIAFGARPGALHARHVPQPDGGEEG